MNTELEQTIGKAFAQTLTGNLLIGGMITTVILFAVIMALRAFIIHLIKGKAEILHKDQRRWINRINNSTTILLLISLVFIWAPQLHTFALSLTAFAVAVVLTTKELLMCLTGGFLRATTKPFDIGDWITVDGATGEVMRITAMATLMEEIDTVHKTYEFTGRTIQIPNSKFLSVNIENVNFGKHYIYYDLPLTVTGLESDPAKLMGKLREITEKHYAPFREAALKFNKKVEKKSAVDFADPEPQYYLRISDSGHTVFSVRMFLPVREALQTGSLITQDFMSAFLKQKNKKAA